MAPIPILTAAWRSDTLFHKLRPLAIGNFNGQFKGMFDLQQHVPTKGEPNTRRYLLDAVLVYQLIIWYGFEHGLILRIRLEVFLKAARFTLNLHLSL